MDVYAQESANGIRMAWNIWPCSRLEAARIAAPVSCLYTPLKAVDGLPLLDYEPLRCRKTNCGAILNPYAAVDFGSRASASPKTWFCPFCGQRSLLPPHYAEQIAPSNLPAELQPSSTTVEYILQRPTAGGGGGGGPAFLLVLDLALIEEELNEAKDSLQQALARMPPNALVGFITFGANCHVHDLSSGSLPRAYAFRGGKDYTARQVGCQLGLASTSGSAARFLQPVGQCEFTLSSLLDELCRDSWPLHPSKRPKRCTGTALSVALALAEAACLKGGARVTLVLGGPCTVGPGVIVGEDTAETIRSRVDLSKGNACAQQSSRAADFYDSLAKRAAARGWAVDIFACALDQVGLHEMKVLCNRTGGYMVMGDSFSLHIFKQSFCKIFDCDESGYLSLGFDARIEVFASRDLACSGAVGCLSSLEKQGPAVSSHEIGEGGTCQWAMGSLDRTTTIGFYFEITNQEARPRQNAFLQFQTAYLHPSGRTRLRVTTVSPRYAESGAGEFIYGFDQEAAAVLVARQAVDMSKSEGCDAVCHMLDRMLIRLMTKFANYGTNDAGSRSFSVPTPLAMFPQFMYHLRRSSLLRTFNSSPDETAFCRALLLRETALNSLVMIQPVLLEYSLENGGVGTPVLLDEAALKPNVILLLDSFFHLVIWRGRQIQGWCDRGVQDLPEYPHLKALLQAPCEDARRLLQERFPVPRFIQTSAGGSQERFLTSRVSPSDGSAASSWQASGREHGIMTDDVSLKVFMEHLIKFVLES